MKLAMRHWCLYRSDITGSHTEGNGKPTRQKCRYCGGNLVTETGLWGVFHWSARGLASDYFLDKAVRTFVRKSAADKLSDDAYDADPESDLVVRWIRIEEKAQAA